MYNMYFSNPGSHMNLVFLLLIPQFPEKPVHLFKRASQQLTFAYKMPVSSLLKSNTQIASVWCCVLSRKQACMAKIVLQVMYCL